MIDGRVCSGSAPPRWSGTLHPPTLGPRAAVHLPPSQLSEAADVCVCVCLFQSAQRQNERWSRSDWECVFRVEQLWGADDEALIDSLLALEWQRGIPASFCPSSLSPCNNLRSGILPAFLYGLVCLSFSSPFTVCNIHAELISSRHRPPEPALLVTGYCARSSRLQFPIRPSAATLLAAPAA